MAKSPNRRQKRPPGQLGGAIKNLGNAFGFTRVHEEECILVRGSGDLTELPRRFTIGVWNICKGLGGPRFFADFGLLTQKTDLFLVQEALLSDTTAPRLLMPSRAIVHATSYRRRDGARDGVMTVSRVPTELRQRILCLQPEPLLKTPKACLLTSYPLPGDEALLVANIHSTLLRSVKQSLAELRPILPLLANHSGPVIFAGDFNTWSPRFLHSLSEDLYQIGLVHCEIDGDSRGRFRCLDQIYFKGLHLESAYLDPACTTSDHFPLIATFHLLG